MLGRHPKALRRLGALFAAGQVEKIYWAVVEGQPPEAEGRIETGLRKLTRGTGWRMTVDPAGQRAITDYRVCGAAGGRAWLELRPRTGRTHQLRVHCAALGCPVVGDPVYGDAARAEDRSCFMRARSACRSIRHGRRSKSPPRCRRICSRAVRRLGYDPASEDPGMIPRYSRPEMSRIWSAENRYRIWFEIEAHACDAQAALGIIPESAARAVRERGAFEVERIDEIERETHHDVIAFLTNLAEHVGPEARFVHQGMTSSDVLDTCLRCS